MNLPTTLFDVAVIGSGPAGSSAAFHLAEQGLKVIIIEKDSLPRYKPCGGALVPRALSFLPLRPRNIVEAECLEASINLLDAGLGFSVQREEPVIFMTMRENLDFFLVSKAKEKGAELFSGCNVIDTVSMPVTTEVKTDKGSVFSKFVVGADGAAGITARKSGWKDSRKLVPAFAYEVSVDEETFFQFGKKARFDFGITPCGYAWLFPKKKHLSIGMLDMKEHLEKPDIFFQRYLKTIGIERTSGHSRHSFLIPVSPRRDGFVRKRVLLAGDAAGFVDPLTGEGISFALKSGALAAKAIIEGNLEEKNVK
jgi:geranylgeranyl reductase family protein